MRILLALLLLGAIACESHDHKGDHQHDAPKDASALAITEEGPVLVGMSEQDVIDRNGAPAHTVQVDGLRVLVYLDGREISLADGKVVKIEAATVEPESDHGHTHDHPHDDHGHHH